jgi:hypothetical protein
VLVVAARARGWPPRDRLDELTERARKVARQIRQRAAGEKITNRLVSMAAADARPVCTGKLRAPTEFGYVIQIAEAARTLAAARAD